MLESIIEYSGWCILFMWLVGAGPCWIYLIRPRRLTRLSNGQIANDDWPLVSLIVVARDEDQAIGRALGTYAALDYPNLEVIAVDDRSTDQTGSIMDRAAAADPRLRVVHVVDLPPGWLGKTHAMQEGYRASTGPWLLFTDGDVMFEPQSVRLAVSHAVRQQRDHVTVYPGLQPGGFWENLMIAMFGLLFTMRVKPWLVRTRFKGAYVGIGAFNLIRREVYEAIGTHQRLALEVADDLKLGKLVKMHHYRQDVLSADDLIRVRWQVGMGGVISGLTKNAFAGLNYSVLNLILSTAILVVIGLGPYVGALLLTESARWGHLYSLAFIHLTFAAICRRGRVSMLGSIIFVVPWTLFLYILWRSAFVTLRDGGVTWRDTFYPLDTLRKNPV